MTEETGSLPGAMFAIRQQEAGGPLSYEKIAVPKPARGEVLVRMDSSPINPSDLAMLRGDYPERSYPFTPGLEGSGTVVSSGAGILPGLRRGARVACSPKSGSDGTWAEYMATSVMNIVPLPKKISLEHGSMMLVNPMTAMAFVQMARKEKHKAIANNAAASTLGKMLNRMCQYYGIPLINIVRKDKQAEELKALGATHVLNCSHSSFESDLKKLTVEMEATLVLDAVSGSQTKTLLNAAPPAAKLISYARLSGEELCFDPASLIKEDKQVAGFQLGNWLHKQNLIFKLAFLSKVKKHLEKELSSTIRYTLPLSRAAEATAEYQANMSEGKILLKA